MNDILKIKTTNRLTGLIVLSALVHVVLFSLFPEKEKQDIANLNISAKIIYSNDVSNNLNENKKNTIKSLLHNKEKPQYKSAINKRTKNTSHQSSNKNKSPKTGISKRSINWYQVKQQIKTKISEKFYYPRLAIRNGWQGTVILALTINHTGEITKHVISQTSGYRILDQAALSSLSKIKHINISENIQYYNPIDIEFPVIYKLNEG